jgi:prophage regulatory protein
MSGLKVLRLKDLISITGLSRVTIWRLELAGNFPRRVQLGPRRVGWVESEVSNWIQSRPRVGNAEKEIE